MTSACSHVGLCVTDLERSRRFYEGAFGFRPAFAFRVEGPRNAQLLRLEDPVEFDAAYLHLDGILLELLAFVTPNAVEARHRVTNEPGLTHFSLFVEDFDATLERVRALGGTVREDTNVGLAVFVEDPDGQMIELLHPDGRFAELRARSLEELAGD